jgi:hypothetical protein
MEAWTRRDSSRSQDPGEPPHSLFHPWSLARVSLLRDAQDLAGEDHVGILDLVAVGLEDCSPAIRVAQKLLRDAR